MDGGLTREPSTFCFIVTGVFFQLTLLLSSQLWRGWETRPMPTMWKQVSVQSWSSSMGWLGKKKPRYPIARMAVLEFSLSAQPQHRLTVLYDCSQPAERKSDPDAFSSHAYLSPWTSCCHSIYHPVGSLMGRTMSASVSLVSSSRIGALWNFWLMGMNSQF